MLDPSKVYGEGFFNDDEAVSQLLQYGYLFVHYPETFYMYQNKRHDQGRSLSLSVNCNDVFAWGCADAENIQNEEELKSLYDWCVTYPNHGSAIWCCIKRNEQPQEPVIKYMKETKCWPGVMDTLPENLYTEMLKSELTSSCSPSTSS